RRRHLLAIEQEVVVGVRLLRVAHGATRPAGPSPVELAAEPVPALPPLWRWRWRRASRPPAAARSMPTIAVRTASNGGKLPSETFASVPAIACARSSATP